MNGIAAADKHFALNVAVEAARAGEYGRGFAVSNFAEVRKPCRAKRAGGRCGYRR